ncbi:hypothetical protein ACFQU7_18580 [Pseudoroseomonas wenyumeiae]
MGGLGLPGHRMLRRHLGQGIGMNGRDQAIRQLRQRPRGGEAGERMLLEGLLHAGLDAAELPPQQGERHIPRHWRAGAWHQVEREVRQGPSATKGRGEDGAMASGMSPLLIILG